MFLVIAPTTVRLQPVRYRPVYKDIFIKEKTFQHYRKHAKTSENTIKNSSLDVRTLGTEVPEGPRRTVPREL